MTAGISHGGRSDGPLPEGLRATVGLRAGVGAGARSGVGAGATGVEAAAAAALAAATVKDSARAGGAVWYGDGVAAGVGA
jgi:hypothetical protein